ncbi:MAG: phosphodiester glycosidase family protein [Clostridia bacterium]|nr:phosphodiester glycosidase family protein [Clostridia bacterium]
MAKLYGNTGSRAHAAEGGRFSPARKKARRLSRRIGTAALLLLLLYGFVVWAPVKPVRRLRNMYIETALSTMSHKWLATRFFPSSVVEQVRQDMLAAQESQQGLTSDWAEGEALPLVIPESQRPASPDAVSDPAMESFFTLFWELDREETLNWLRDEPALLENGWAHLAANRSGLKESGLPIHTVMGEQVLAIDAYQQILLVRVKGSGYRGVLAIAKDPARLSLQAAASIGSSGQPAGVIAEANDGLLAMTASGFWDDDGRGSGGAVTGYALCGGTEYGRPFGTAGYKRFEKRNDDLLYIMDSSSPLTPSATDAMEFTPALIVDGEIVVDDSCGWTATNPRACLGQSRRREILMLVIEGRLPTVSVGTNVIECAEILARHDGMQAMNMDGGTSAMLYYDGEYVTLCSNTALPAGRRLPNAWVYGRRSD